MLYLSLNYAYVILSNLLVGLLKELFLSTVCDMATVQHNEVRLVRNPCSNDLTVHCQRLLLA